MLCQHGDLFSAGIYIPGTFLIPSDVAFGASLIHDELVCSSGLLSDPPLPFNTAIQRFDQRFSAFHSSVTHPEPVSFPDFIASTDTKGFNPEQLLLLATESFNLVRRLPEWFTLFKFMLHILCPSITIGIKIIQEVCLSIHLYLLC